MKLLSPSLSVGLLTAAFVMAASTQATAQEYTFTTLAGPADVGSGDADGPGNLARFCPIGVAVDSAGNVYVSDSANSNIRLGRPACPDAPMIDLGTGTVGQARFYRAVRLPAQ